MVKVQFITEEITHPAWCLKCHKATDDVHVDRAYRAVYGEGERVWLRIRPTHTPPRVHVRIYHVSEPLMLVMSVY